MIVFIVEVFVLCALFTLSCMSQANGLMDHLERNVVNYPEPIVQRLIEQGKISRNRTFTFAERMKKKWPIMIVFGIFIGILVRYVNGCVSFISGFGTSYLIWTIVDWYDALIIDCVWFCHSKKCIISGTEDLVDAYHDYKFHIRRSCLGMLVGLVVCLIAGLVVEVLGYGC